MQVQVLLSAPPTEDSPFRRKNMRLFHGLIFFRYFGSLPPPADNRSVRNCNAHVPRYIHFSAFPNGVRYSVLASLVLTSPVKSDMLILVCTTTASSCAVHAHASRHFRASLRRLVQCTLTRLDTSVPRRPLSAFAVRQVLLSAPPTEDSPFRRKNMRLFHGLIFQSIVSFRTKIYSLGHTFLCLNFLSKNVVLLS